jgi:hypothetical protein
LTTGGNDITGCSILTGGKMVFINFHPVYLLILNVDGSKERNLSLPIWISTIFSSFKSTFLKPLPMAENTNIPFAEVIPLQIVLELMHFTVSSVLRSTSVIYLSTGDTSVLKTPCSIAVDEYGNVYVVGTDSVNVIVISPDGKEHRQLLSKADRLERPKRSTGVHDFNNTLILQIHFS